MSTGEQRCGDSDRCGNDGCCQEFVFHRRSTKNFIGAERYAAYGRVSMLLERRGGKKRSLILSRCKGR
jgi:hypothetical protein